MSTFLVIGCDIGPSNQASVNTSGNAADLPTYGVPESQGSYVVFNQRLIEGISDTPVDIQDVDAVFWHVFSSLPDEIIVYPTENYYYYKLYMDGKQFWGNIRLPAGRRDRGVLSFAYFEFKESPLKTGPRLERWKYYTKEDG